MDCNRCITKFFGKIHRLLLNQKKERKMKKRKGNIIIYFIIFFIVSGYTFFFASNFIIPNSDKYQNTKLNQEISFQNRLFRITRWQYSEQQNLMEVELSIENRNLDGKDTYNYSVATKPIAKNTEVETIIEERNFVVLQIKNLPKDFTEISLRVGVQDNNDSLLRLYTNKKDVEYVDNIEAKTLNEYMLDKIDRDIVIYNNYIKELKTKIAENEDKIEIINDTIKDLEEDKLYQTDEEISETNNSINSYSAEIERCEDDINAINEEIKEYELKIQKSKEKKDALK